MTQIAPPQHDIASLYWNTLCMNTFVHQNLFIIIVQNVEIPVGVFFPSPIQDLLMEFMTSWPCYKASIFMLLVSESYTSLYAVEPFQIQSLIKMIIRCQVHISICWSLECEAIL